MPATRFDNSSNFKLLLDKLITKKKINIGVGVKKRTSK